MFPQKDRTLVFPLAKTPEIHIDTGFIYGFIMFYQFLLCFHKLKEPSPASLCATMRYHCLARIWLRSPDLSQPSRATNASCFLSFGQFWSLNVFNQGCAQKPTRGYKRENWDITGQHEQIRPQQAMNCIGIDWSNPEFFVKSNEIPQFHTTHFHTCPSIHVHTFPWNVQLLCGQIVSYQNR